MTTFISNLKLLQHSFWSLNKPNLAINTDITNSIYKYCNQSNKSNCKLRLLILNINHFNEFKFDKILGYINQFKPNICWFIEAWRPINNLYGFNKYISNDIYMNHLFIRSDLCRNRVLKTIEFGFQFEDLCFRYIPPNIRKDFRVKLSNNEFGDFNFLSNQNWLNNEGFFYELRMDKPGGMGFKTQYDIGYNFINWSKDHKGIFIEFKDYWVKYLKADANKIKYAIDNILLKKDDDNIDYIWKNTDNYKQPISNKIINPVKEGLNFEPWFELYKHNCPKISNGKLHNVYSKAYDINNRPYNLIINELKGRNNNVINKFVKINNNNSVFCSKTICLLKKDKQPDVITNLRPIQISPINMKIAEQSRNNLKDWLMKFSEDDRICAFNKGCSTFKAFEKFAVGIKFDFG